MLANYAVLLALCLGQSEVANSPRSGFASSDNFVIYAPDQELADEVLKKAEELRTNIARAWLGKKFAPGIGAAMIHIKLSSIENCGFTWPKDHPAKRYHSVSIKSSREQILSCVLAHEMTHVVLATEFADRIPRWADEGIACFQSGDAVRHKFQASLGQFIATNDWPNLLDVLNQKGVGSDEQNFYTVANSLSEFLLERGESDVFFRFALDGKEKGWEFAVSKHYEISSLDSLESEWHEWVRRTCSSTQKRPLSASRAEVTTSRKTQ